MAYIHTDASPTEVLAVHAYTRYPLLVKRLLQRPTLETMVTTLQDPRVAATLDRDEKSNVAVS
ncbi:hypothetical protein MHAE_12358 [Mycobacterium haemophilum DSM 44634]